MSTHCYYFLENLFSHKKRALNTTVHFERLFISLLNFVLSFPFFDLEVMTKEEQQRPNEDPRHPKKKSTNHNSHNINNNNKDVPVSGAQAAIEQSKIDIMVSERPTILRRKSTII